MRRIADTVALITICLTVLVGIAGITYALVSGWRNANTPPQYFLVSAGTAFYAVGVGSATGGLIYAWLSRRKRPGEQDSP